MANQFDLRPAPAIDPVSAVSWSPSSNKLLVSSWDRTLYLYDILPDAENHLIRKFEHRAPILDVCFGEDETTAYSVGLDWDVRKIDLESGDQTVLSSHEMGANAIVYDSHHNLLISASWDKTLHIHHTSNPSIEPATLTLPAKPFKLAISSSKLVVAMANRLIYIYDLAAIAMISSQSSQPAPNPIDLEPLQIRESSLKFMTKAVASMPSGEGYASSSIEGRVAVEWFDASEESQNRKYAFKCHRQAAPIDPNADPEDAESNVDIVYPVNALAFHPTFGTFVSGGGDAVVAVWDAVAKRRIRQFAKYADGIAAMAFSPDGQWLAVATSPQFEEDTEFEPEKGAVQIAIRQVTEKEFNARK